MAIYVIDKFKPKTADPQKPATFKVVDAVDVAVDEAGTSLATTLTTINNNITNIQTDTEANVVKKITLGTEEKTPTINNITISQSDIQTLLGDASTSQKGLMTSDQVNALSDKVDTATLQNLDFTGTGAARQTITSLTQKDGQIDATFADIQIAQSQVNNLTSDLGTINTEVRAAKDAAAVSAEQAKTSASEATLAKQAAEATKDQVDGITSNVIALSESAAQAKNDAEAAKTSAQAAETNANTAKTAAENAEKKATAAESTVSTYNTRLSAVETGKQDKLISGTNIKTINNESILDSGNLEVGGVKLVDSLPIASEAKPTTIYAVGYNENMDFYIVKRPLPKLENVTNLAQSDKTITWDAVPNAEKYKLSLNGVDLGTVTDTSYLLTNASNWSSLSDGNHPFTIIAQATNYRDSDVVNFQVEKSNKYPVELVTNVIAGPSGSYTVCTIANNGIVVASVSSNIAESSTETIYLTIDAPTTFTTDNYNSDLTMYVEGDNGNQEYYFGNAKSYTYNGKITKLTWEVYD